ncbi:hypothetical protein EST38_g1412 [Candolleomyces aberdarensis]|uniref:Ras GEF n=1 Tax=Candolleomyces aberdarensis TaxID=2316362 RepID=A0A4Q2DUY8_9AGAR|nr:hypothetical protein EST38_g1412 [Candolleomyces aberdarensis]
MAPSRPGRASRNHKSASVHSNQSTPSSPEKSSPSSCADLKHAFPSIYASMGLMGRYHSKNNVSDWRTVASVFLSTYQSILVETAKFPGVDSSDSDLQECRACGVGLGKALERHIQNLATHSDPKSLTLAFEHVKMTLAALEHLYQVSLLRSRQKKSLPELPLDEGSDSSSVYHDAVSTTHSELQSARVFSPDAPAPSIISHAKSASMGSGSSVTLVNSSAISRVQDVSVPQSTVRLVGKPKVQAVASNPPAKGRMSRKVVRPFNPQPDLPSYMLEEYDDPRLEPDDPKPAFQGLVFNIDGKPNAGSIQGFIRLLSSSQGITDQNLLNTLFTCFRDFTTPQEFFLHLQARFEEDSAREDDKAGQIECHAVRVRVLKLLLYWLDRHWKAGSDEDVLPDIKHFIQHCTQGVVPDKANLMVLLHERLASIEHPNSTSNSNNSTSEPRLHKPKAPKSPSKKKKKIKIKHRADPVIQLLAFNSEKNCRALSHQITLMISEMYQRVHPTDMASYWGLGPDEKKQYEKRKLTDAIARNVLGVRDFEEAIAVWVTYTVLKPYDEEQRVQLVSMWLSVAICCLDDRNYSSAFCIFNGVAHHAVRRMRDTVVKVPRQSKAQYHRLERFFSGRGNYSEVRLGMNNNNTQAIVPLSAVLKHDMGVSRAVHPKKIDVKNDQEEQTELINLTGYEVMAKTVRTLGYCIAYPFAEDQATQEWLSGELNRFSDFSKVEEYHNRLEERSLKRQPEIKGKDKSYDPWQRVREKDMIVPLSPEEMAQGSAGGVLRTGLARSIKSFSLKQAAINLATRNSPR